MRGTSLFSFRGILWRIFVGTKLPAKIPILGVPNESQAGEQLDELCQEDCRRRDEHVSRPGVGMSCYISWMRACQRWLYLVLAYRMDRPSTAFCPVSVTKLELIFCFTLAKLLAQWWEFVTNLRYFSRWFSSAFFIFVSEVILSLISPYSCTSEKQTTHNKVTAPSVWCTRTQIFLLDLN